MMRKKNLLYIYMIGILSTNTAIPYIDYEYLEKLTYLKKEQVEELEKKIINLENILHNTLDNSYKALATLLKNNNLKKGCFLGIPLSSSYHIIFEQTNIEVLYSMDAYQKQDLKNKHLDNEFLKNVLKSAQGSDSSYNWLLDIWYYKIKHNLQQFNKRSKLIRLHPSHAKDLFFDNELDFVFFGFNPEYSYIMENIEIWHEKVKFGGIIAGIIFQSNKDSLETLKTLLKTKEILSHPVATNAQFWWTIKL